MREFPDKHRISGYVRYTFEDYLRLVDKPEEIITRSSVPKRALHRLRFIIGEPSLQKWQNLDWKDLFIRGSEATPFNNTLTQRQYTVDSDGDPVDSVSEHEELEPMPSAHLSPGLQAQLDAIPTPSNTPNVSPADSTTEIKSETPIKDEVKQESEDERLKQELQTAAAEHKVKDSPTQEDAADAPEGEAPAPEANYF